MYIDSSLVMARSQTLTATGGTTDGIDLGADHDYGIGHPLWCVVVIETVPDNANGDETYTFSLSTDDNSSFSSISNLWSVAIARTAPAGTRIILSLPNTNERYIRGTMSLGGTTPSITFSAWLTSQEPADWRAYPDAI